MALPIIGKVFLDGGQFTTDPRIRREWNPRRRRLLGIAGSATQQDWGRFAGDMRLTLESGGNFINHDFKAFLDGRLLVRNAKYTYTDYQGLDADVVVVNFIPVATFYRDTSVDSRGCLWEYTLLLDVVKLRKLDFQAYTGK